MTLLDLKKDYELKMLKINRENLPEPNMEEIVKHIKGEVNLIDVQHKIEVIRKKFKQY